MPIENWSYNVLLVELADEPQFSEDIEATIAAVKKQPKADVVLNFQNVSLVGSSSMSALLRLRKQIKAGSSKLRLAAINTRVWGSFLVSGLDKVFDVYNDLASALASLHVK